MRLTRRTARFKVTRKASVLTGDLKLLFFAPFRFTKSYSLKFSPCQAWGRK